MKYSVKSAPPPGGDPSEFVMSDNRVDRMGDVIEADGWDLKNFKSHPIALFNHDPNQVIGTWAEVRIEGKQLRGRLDLAEAGTSPLVDTVRALHSQGILRAVSVGFRPIDKKPLTKDADEYFGPFRFTKSELLECSLVAVPANPRALNAAKSLAIAGDMLAEVFGKPAEYKPRPALNAKPGQRPHAFRQSHENPIRAHPGCAKPCHRIPRPFDGSHQQGRTRRHRGSAIPRTAWPDRTPGCLASRAAECRARARRTTATLANPWHAWRAGDHRSRRAIRA
jgi:HK97 family phage prohead protease